LKGLQKDIRMYQINSILHGVMEFYRRRGLSIDVNLKLL
jgi:hypothetical protein